MNLRHTSSHLIGDPPAAKAPYLKLKGLHWPQVAATTRSRGRFKIQPSPFSWEVISVSSKASGFHGSAHESFDLVELPFTDGLTGDPGL